MMMESRSQEDHVLVDALLLRALLSHESAVELALSVAFLHFSPQLAALALRPLLNLVVFPLDAHHSWHSLLLANLAAELGLHQQRLFLLLLAQGTLLLNAGLQGPVLGGVGEGSGGEIGEHSLGVDSHALVGAVAVFGVWQSLQPGKSGVVDCLSDVVAEIEAAVVAASQDQHELARTLFCLRYLQLRYLAFEKVGIDESGFVPEVLRASAKMLREVFLSLPLQQVRLGFRNGVPKLVLSFVKVVDGGEVEVFLVPAKKSLPGPDVAVGGGHSSHILRDCVPEQRIESVQIPLSTSFIHEAADQVCPVEGGRKHNALPKLNRLAFTMLYTYSADLPAVSLSKGAAFSRQSLRLIDFLGMCRHQQMPPFPKTFCSMGPLTFRWSNLSAQSLNLHFHSGGGTTCISKKEKREGEASRAV